MASHTSVLLLFSLVSGVCADGFLSKNAKKVQQVRDELNSVLSRVLGHGHGVDASGLADITVTIKPMFDALPKNRQGRLSAAVMRYVVSRYFQQHRGWIMKGFEPHSVADSEANLKDGANIMEERVPDFIRSVLEQKFSHNGFALGDLAAMIAALEKLALNEVVRVVELSFDYSFPFRDATQGLDHDSLMSVLTSYLLIEMRPWTADNATKHVFEKSRLHRIYPHFNASTLPFISDIANNHAYQHGNTRNPFSANGYSFDDAVRISQHLSERLGPHSDFECKLMKNMLAEMDTQETGRVKVSDFYSKNLNGQWQFVESFDYLRSVGAVDDSSALLGAQVIIPNYVAGMNNCLTSTPYYAICCLNECEHVYQELEKSIASDSASPAEIAGVIEDMKDGKNLSLTVRTRLDDIATVHHGKVPLHGRLLAQWLHFVFPRECPYPHVAGTTAPLTPAKYEETGGIGSSDTTEEESALFLNADSARLAPSPEAGALMWNLHEMLLDSATPSDAETPIDLRSVVRIGASVLMFGSLVVFVLNEARGVFGIMRRDSKPVQHIV